MGRQGKDPSTDFRGGGFISLENFLFFARNFSANNGNLDAAVEQLLNVEKQMRLAGDVAGTRKAATDILQLCFEARAWKTSLWLSGSAMGTFYSSYKRGRG